VSAVATAVERHQLLETTLGALAEYITSGSRDWSKYYAASGALFIRTQDINQNRLSLDDVARVRLPAKVEGKRSLVRKGDLLITITGANVGKVAVVEQEVPEAYVSQSVCLVRLKDPSLANFLQLQLIARRGEKSSLEAMAYGLGRPVLNLENIRAARVKVGSPKVMAEIVAVIEKQFSRLDEAVANLKRVKAGLGRYRAAVLAQTTFGTGGSLFVDGEVALRIDGEVHDLSVYLPKLPSHWRWTTVGSVGRVKGGKRLPAGHRYAAERTPYPYVRVTDFLDFGIDTSGLQFLSEPTHREIERYTISASDVYISIAGSIGLVGQMPAHLNNTNLTENAAKITSLKDIEAKYLVYWLASPIGRQLIAKSTIATTQSKLALFRIEKLPVPLPPLDEQRRIVVEVDRRLSIVREVEAAVDANLKRAQALRQATLGKAFNGEGGV
jgi:type I restriction enzyme S subunit